MDAISLLSTINGMIGSSDNNNDSEQQQQYQLELMKKQSEYNKQATEQQYKAQQNMYEYTGYASKVRQLKEAGLNPGLIYGMGASGGGVTGNITAPQVSQGSAPNVAQTTQNKTMQQGMMLQLAKLASEIEVNKSVAQVNKATAELSGEKSQTEPWNRILVQTENELKQIEVNYQLRTIEERVDQVTQVLKNTITQNAQISADITIKENQAAEIAQKITQAAIRFDFDIKKTIAETEKIIKETTNMNITGAEGKWMDMIKALIPGIIGAIKK